VNLQNDEIDAESRWTTAQLTVTVQFVRSTRATEVAPTSTESDLRVSTARELVDSAQLSAPPLRLDVAKAAGLRFDAAKEQATVVGSDIISFVKSVSPEQRIDMVNASLFAQLVANKKIAGPKTLDDVNAWYDVYFDALSAIGFVVQETGFAVHQEENQGFEAQEAILDAATVLLAGSSEALRLVESSLEALRKMSADNPCIVLLNRASRSVNTSRFRVMVVDQDETTQLRVSLMAFGLEAKSRLTQALFFKLYNKQVMLRHYSGRLTTNEMVLAGVRELIARKVVPYRDQYIKPLPDL
jgi:hypothetical protein